MTFRFLISSILFILSPALVGAQVQNAPSRANTINANIQQTPTSRAVSSLTFRIEGGKFWINGNLVQEQNLPKSLLEIDRNLFYQTTVFGIEEITFSLRGRNYLVKDDRVVEFANDKETQPAYEQRKGQEAAQGYYSDIKRESPTLFQSMNREGMLYEQAQRLVWQYQKAKSKDKPAIKDELRSVLGQIFDLNERNRELEIRELEQMIESAKREVSYRKSSKQAIVNNALEELLAQ